METLESALKLILSHVSPLRDTEALPLSPALLGRIAAKNILCPMPVPPFDRSPLDGYALHAEDIQSASRETPAMLRVIGEACAGCTTHFSVAPGEALRIMTGAPVPQSCDCVIRQEDTDEGEETVQIYAPVPSGGNICLAGEDIQKDALIVPRGARLNSGYLGLLSSCGITEVCVARRPRIALLCTGDELKQPGETIEYGQIYDSNQLVLSCRLMELGCELMLLKATSDEPDETARALEGALPKADLVITTGGVSVGKRDVMHRALPLLSATRLFWRLAMKPGSPMIASEVSGRLILSLSGNPFAALVNFELLCVPAIRKLMGDTSPLPQRFTAPLAGSFPKKSGQRRFCRAFFDGQQVHLPSANHSNGSLSGVETSNCLIDLPAGTPPIQAGEMVEVVML